MRPTILYLLMVGACMALVSPAHAEPMPMHTSAIAAPEEVGRIPINKVDANIDNPCDVSTSEDAVRDAKMQLLEQQVEVSDRSDHQTLSSAEMRRLHPKRGAATWPSTIDDLTSEDNVAIAYESGLPELADGLMCTGANVAIVYLSNGNVINLRSGESTSPILNC